MPRSHRSSQRSYPPGQMCECPNRKLERQAKFKTFDSKGDFIPLESILEDNTPGSSIHSSKSQKKRKKKKCCIHGAPCVLAKSPKQYSSLSTHNSLRSCSSTKLNEGFIGNHSSDNNCQYLYKKKAPSFRETAKEKVRIDQDSGPQMTCSHKTRWPITELSRGTSGASSTIAPNNGKKQPDAVYDFLDDCQSTASETIGHRKQKKKKDANLGEEEDDNGYIELSIPPSPPRSKGPKSCRRKDKKKKKKALASRRGPARKQPSDVWSNLPYADLGYLKDKRVRTPSRSDDSSTKSLSSTRSSSSSSASSQPPLSYVDLSSDLEMVCRYYRGHQLRSEVQQGQFAPDSFVLYHRLPDWKCDVNELKKCIRLYILYVTPLKNFVHYAILKRESSYSVDCDDKWMFPTLSHLVKHYASNKTFNGIHQKQRFPGD